MKRTFDRMIAEDAFAPELRSTAGYAAACTSRLRKTASRKKRQSTLFSLLSVSIIVSAFTFIAIHVI